MIILLKELILISIAALTAIGATLGLSSQEVIAPDVEPPAKIVATEEEEPVHETISTSTSEENIEETLPTPDVVTTETPISETPEIAEVIEDPFEEIAEAFAKLAEEQAQKPAPQVPDTNALVRGSLVNIICTTESAGPVNPISASGVVIDSRGVVLTNAHVAQFFLLANYPVPGFIDCSIRTGSPAKPTYTAELLFLPASWIAKNAHKIDDESPTGNGEHDYALVRITGTIGTVVAPLTDLTYLPVALSAPENGDQALVAGYPAGFLGGVTIAKELHAASAETTIGEQYTYEAQTVDLFSIGGSVVAQQGSSGGAVANKEGHLVGLIVTSSEAPDTASRDLRALSTEYIIRDFAKEAGIGLGAFLSLNLAEQARIFQITIAPTLTKTLTDVFEN